MLSRWSSLLFAFILGTASLFMLSRYTAASTQTPPLPGEHCGDVGTPPEEWCGCVWGYVYIDGLPTAGISVTVQHSNGSMSDITTDYSGDEPLFAIDGRTVGAVYGDVLTVTAVYNGNTISRTYRAFPDQQTFEQQVSLAFPTNEGNAPSAVIDAVQIPINQLHLSGSGQDNDESGNSVVGYEWHSDLDGVIGTESSFRLPLAHLTAVNHTLHLRVLDDEGMWSSPAQTSLPLDRPHPLHLSPLLNGHNTPASTPISITYNQAINPASISSQNWTIYAIHNSYRNSHTLARV